MSTETTEALKLKCRLCGNAAPIAAWKRDEQGWECPTPKCGFQIYGYITYRKGPFDGA